MRDGKKDVLTAKKFAVDRMLRKPSDLVRSAAPPVATPAAKKK